MVGFGFLPQNCGKGWNFFRSNAIYCSVNVDGVVFLLGGGGDTSTTHAVIELV